MHQQHFNRIITKYGKDICNGCVYYKKTDVVGVLDSLQEKLAIGTGEIQFSNFDGERYTVKALNSHIYSHKIPGTINRTIHRYTQKHLINAYEFLNFFNLLRKVIVFVVDATAISLIEILENTTVLNPVQLAAVHATRIYFVECLATAYDSARKAAATDSQFHRGGNFRHIRSCYTANK